MPEAITESRPNRLIIKDLIIAGDATKESLLETIGCSAASLATNFTYLRLMGFYPVKAEDETFSFVDEAAWNEITAERKAKAVTRKTAAPKTPEAVLAAALKRMDRCTKAHATALVKDEEFDNEITDLRLTIATAELRLAEIALDLATEAMPDTDEVIEVEVDETETDDDLV